VAVTAYSPLSGCDLEDPTLRQIAAQHGVTTAAVVIRWLRRALDALLPMRVRLGGVRVEVPATRTILITA
jgi:diketogulonate reductase-like aldo/keto reductase